MVVIKHKGAEIRMSNEGEIRVVMPGGRVLPCTPPTVTAARVSIAHTIYRERELGC